MPNVTYHRRKSLGQCVLCGGNPEEGKMMCLPCNDKARASSRRWAESHPNDHIRLRRKAAGLCECGAGPGPGGRTCGECRKYNVKKTRESAVKKRAAGLCPC